MLLPLYDCCEEMQVVGTAEVEADWSYTGEEVGRCRRWWWSLCRALRRHFEVRDAARRSVAPGGLMVCVRVDV